MPNNPNRKRRGASKSYIQRVSQARASATATAVSVDVYAAAASAGAYGSAAPSSAVPGEPGRISGGGGRQQVQR